MRLSDDSRKINAVVLTIYDRRDKRPSEVSWGSNSSNSCHTPYRIQTGLRDRILIIRRHVINNTTYLVFGAGKFYLYFSDTIILNIVPCWTIVMQKLDGIVALEFPRDGCVTHNWPTQEISQVKHLPKWSVGPKKLVRF